MQIDICFVGVVDPVLGSLSDFVLYLPLGCLGFISRGDMWNISHDTIHGKCFSAIIGRALGSVMARLLNLKQVKDIELLVSPRSFCGGVGG